MDSSAIPAFLIAAAKDSSAIPAFLIAADFEDLVLSQNVEKDAKRTSSSCFSFVPLAIMSSNIWITFSIGVTVVAFTLIARARKITAQNREAIASEREGTNI